ncbi:hypothetical protein OESDEN_25061 [Oesophagostomum dentatum]|uniref:Uncharacterized protein n=1 Tax=Oesophagostomum dentatum TaxID=61180 RepID=A0A0B1RQI9_OESDE|nr:hypothetical protein OESDEN_25061 [Oesophagostomum dentatum]
MNPFVMPSPYGLNPMYDAMMAYPDCIGLNACGVPYGGYGMYGNMNGMNGMNGMSGMNGMVNGLNGVNAMNGYSGVNGMNNVQSGGTLNNGNTMRSSLNRVSGARTRYGAVGCNGGCNNGGWLDAAKTKKA